MVYTVLFCGLIVPFALAMAALFAAYRTGPRSIGPRALGLSVGLGCVSGMLGQGWPPPFPPIDVTDRTPWLALAAMIVVAIAGGGPAWLRRIGLALLAVGVYLAILGPILGTTAAIGLSVAGLAVLAAWANAVGLGDRVEGAALIGPMLVVAAGASVVLLASGTATAGLLGLTLAASLFAPALASIRLDLGRSARGVLPVALAVATALVLNGTFYAFVPRSSALLLAAAPAGAWAARLGPVRRRSPWLATFAAVLGTLAPVAAAVAIALASSPSAEEF